MECFPEDVLRHMQSYENALRETVSAGQLVHSAELTYTVSSIAGAVYRDCERSASGFHRKDMTYNEWLCRIVDLLFLSCEGTEIKTTSTGLSSLLGASLKLNSKDAQAFHRVANLLFLKCFLFGSRVNYASISTKSEGNLIFLEKISATSPKWNQGLCESILTRWKECDVGESEQILAKRLLYQWTYSALNGVTKIVSDKMSVLEIKGNYVEAARLGDEYIEFLQEFNNCLDPVFNNCLDPEFNNCLDPVETEFLYTEFYCFYTRTAKLRFKLGEYEQAQSLCEELLRLFRELEDYDDVKIPIWPEGKIVYTQPSVVTMLARRNETLGLMIDSLGAKSQDFSPYQHQLNENLRKLKQLHPGDGILEYSPESLQIPNLSQLTELALLIQAGRYSEAEQAFVRYKEETALEASLDPGSLKTRLLSMRHWLEYSYAGTSVGDYPSCLEYSSSEWQALCEKFELVLDMTEFAGDPMLTAEIVRRYGTLIGDRSLYKFKRKANPGDGEDKDSGDLMLWQDYADKLERWLKEEVGLPITATEGVQEVALLSCFSEPCGPGEHKKELPPMLKTYRLLKSFIDTFSRLLHDWTKGSADEAGWLKLLESQKWGHLALQEYLLHISEHCLQFVELGNGFRKNNSTHDMIFNQMYDASIFSTLVWTERGRARSLLHQLGPAYAGLHDDRTLETMREELINFDLDDKRAFSSIMSCHQACKGAVFVEYFLTRYNSAAFVTYGGPGDKKHVEVRFQWVQFKCDEKRVEQLVGDFYKAVNPNSDRKVEYEDHLVAGYLEELYKMLIKPVWPLLTPGLRSKSTLVFVPDKILNRVPFALLRDRNRQKYLFELHPISVAPSLRVLHHCKRRLSYLESCPLKPGRAILAMGDASYTDTPLLPASGKEVTELAERFPGLVYKLEKSDATRANLLALLEESSVSNEKHAFGLMHLGVHCNWNDSTFKTGAIQFAKPSRAGKSRELGAATGAPNVASTSRDGERLKEAVPSTSHDGERLQSVFGEVGVLTRDYGFESSSSSGEDSMLRSEDIIAIGLQWPTCLVVLSACNSSKGQVFGDGEVNLPRALMIAGVPASLVAQWKVVDEASRKLMKVFYDSLQEGQDVATALQSSMLDALRVHKSNSASKIHEWGPFVVWGLPSVQLPKKLWTEDARNALPEPVFEAGISSFEREMIMSDVSKLQNFLASTDDGACASENNSGIYDVILAALKLINVPHVLNSHMKLVEQVFIKMPLEHLHKAEMQLEATHPGLLFAFRFCTRFAQAIQGNFQVALDYANALIADQTTPYPLLQRQERAVLLRLLGRHGEALKELDDLLADGFDYECQIERSCVRYLMGDKDRALEDARHAQRMNPMPGQLAPLQLSLHAIPPEFRELISNVCDTTHLYYHLLVPVPSSSSASIFTDDGGSGSGIAAACGAYGFGVDPNLDPELALALRISMEEEQTRQEAATKRSVKHSTAKELQAGECSSTRVVAMSDAGLAEIRDKSIIDSLIDDDAALLDQALAVSMSEIPLAKSDLDDQDLAHALQMSMQEQC